MMPETLQRYLDVVEDKVAFREALSRPLPGCVWPHPRRMSRDELVRALAAEGIDGEVLAWHPSGVRIKSAARPGLTWMYAIGLLHIQEEASLLPVQLLDPQPGERVLDLCAAPGNKTAEIALRVGDTGTVVACDRSRGRMSPLRRTVECLGLANVVTIVADGTRLPAAVGTFDRVLVDAPCSCEGRSRLTAGKKPTWQPLARPIAIQQSLLRRAFALCRPGGRIVYATCTYAPEENEAVVHDFLARQGDAVELLSAKLPGFAGHDGLPSWEGVTFDPRMSRCLRVWPHDEDTGGFFVAVFERRGSGSANVGALLGSDTALGDSGELVLSTYGIRDEVLTRYALGYSGSRNDYLVTRGLTAPVIPRPDASGIGFINSSMRLPKLTTGAAMLLGRTATRNVAEVDAAGRDRYIARQTLERAAWSGEAEGPFLLVRFLGHVLGVGLARKDGSLESYFPKAWSRPC